MNTVYLFTEIIEKRIINTSWSKINEEVGGGGGSVCGGSRCRGG